MINAPFLFQEVVNLWANMTGFLCALGGVCLLHHASVHGSPRLR